MSDPRYGAEHVRIRAALLASGTWLGAPCFFCGEKMWPGERLALAHVDGPDGRAIEGKYRGITHASCNETAARRVDPWGHHRRDPAAIAARSPERVAQLADRAARRERRDFRREFDAAQHQDSQTEKD